MTKCIHCGNTKFRSTTHNDSRKIAGRSFTTEVSANVCAACGELTLAAEMVSRIELQIARELAEAGERSGEAFRFMRKAAGVPGKELAELFDVTPETVSRWENGKTPVERRALALLTAIVSDAQGGTPSTIERLRGLQAPKKLGKTVRVNLT